MNLARPILRRTLAAALVAASLSLLPGCPAPPRELTGSGMDMFAPVHFRLHPLTRTVRTNGKNEVEARLEFTDQMGDITKGVASLYFELYPYEVASVSHKGPRVGLWNADISTPADNKQHWDPITRTYLFHLGVPDPRLLAPGRKFVLSATVVFPNNTRLSEDLTLTVK